MRTYGFELECSDIKTSDAAQIVYGTLNDWPDFPFGYDKPELDYTKWNCLPDSTIKNTDGTQCMKTHIENGSIVKSFNGRNSIDKWKWSGAELISPAVSSDEGENLIRFSQLDTFIDLFKQSGATFSGKNCNAVHVHLNIDDLESFDVMGLISQAYLCQSILKPLGSSWTGSKLFTEDQMSRFWRAEDNVDKWWQEYCTPSNRLLQPNRIGVRRIVDVGSYFSDYASYKTVEFRCFKSVGSVEYISSCIALCMWLLERWIAHDPLAYRAELQDRVDKLLTLQNG